MSVQTSDPTDDWRQRGFSCDIWTDAPGQVWRDFVHATDELVMPLEGEIEFEISEDETDPATGNPATPWLTNPGRLAIQLRADHRLAITSLERFDNSNCADMVPQPTLTLTICAP